MDSLPITQGVSGLATAARQITSTLYEFTSAVKEAPSLALAVMTEVHAINMIISNIQAFLWGGAQGLDALVMVEDLVVVLTGCVLIFSDLEREVCGLRAETARGRKALRLGWARRADAVAQIFERLRGHRAALNLILTVLGSNSPAHAEKNVEQLRALTTHLLAQQATPTMSDRLKCMQANPSQLPSTSTTSTANPTSTSTSTSTSRPRSLRARLSQTFSSSTAKSTFDNDLHASRVYKRALFRTRSLTALRTSVSAPANIGWSYLSALSLADLSHVSILMLPVHAFELSNSSHYTFTTTTTTTTTATTATTTSQPTEPEPEPDTHSQTASTMESDAASSYTSTSTSSDTDTDTTAASSVADARPGSSLAAIEEEEFQSALEARERFLDLGAPARGIHQPHFLSLADALETPEEEFLSALSARERFLGLPATRDSGYDSSEESPVGVQEVPCVQEPVTVTVKAAPLQQVPQIIIHAVSITTTTTAAAAPQQQQQQQQRRKQEQPVGFSWEDQCNQPLMRMWGQHLSEGDQQRLRRFPRPPSLRSRVGVV